jgi:hypothetical protein
MEHKKWTPSFRTDDATRTFRGNRIFLSKLVFARKRAGAALVELAIHCQGKSPAMRNRGYRGMSTRMNILKATK